MIGTIHEDVDDKFITALISITFMKWAKLMNQFLM
jgi:hypothetical protein